MSIMDSSLGTMRPGKVLVVDDERSTVRLLEFILKKQGYEVATAFGGEQGLTESDRFFPDAILLDLQMPDLSGEEVLDRLRANPAHKNRIVVVLSANTTENIAQIVKNRGANAHCTKPIAPSTLLQTLEDLGVSPRISLDARGPSAAS